MNGSQIIIDNVSNKPLGQPLMRGISQIATTHKLQRISADAILSE